MNSASGKKIKPHMPISGDKAIDMILVILLSALEKEIEAVRLKDVLRDPDNPHKELHGLLTCGEIYLGKRKHKLKKAHLASTLIHELLHLIMPRKKENYILDREEFLWVRLTDYQKKYLRRYIPRHTVKKEP